jgi:hypothetical protein
VHDGEVGGALRKTHILMHIMLEKHSQCFFFIPIN